jgi:hypothetical protein
VICSKMNVQNLRKRVTRSLSRIEAQEKQMKKRAKLHNDEKSNNGLEPATSCYKNSTLAGKEVMKGDKISTADQKLITKKNSTTYGSIFQSVSSISKRARKIKSNEEEEEGKEEAHREAAKALAPAPTPTALNEKQSIPRNSSIKESSVAVGKVAKGDNISIADQKLVTKKKSTSGNIFQSISSTSKRSKKSKSNEKEEDGKEETHNEAAKAPVTATATATATKEKQIIPRKSSIRRTKKTNGTSFSSSLLLTAKAQTQTQTPASAPATIASKEKQAISRESSIRSTKQTNGPSSSTSSSSSSALSTAAASISGSLPSKRTSSSFLSSSSSGGSSSSNNKDQQKCAVPLVAVTARNNLISSGVIIPRSVKDGFLCGTLLDNLNILQSSNLINDALQEFDEAVRVKGRSIRNHRAYLIGVLKRYLVLKKRTAKGSGTDSLPMGLGEGITPPIYIRLQKLINDGFCTSYEINEMVKPRLWMLSEKVAMIVLNELNSSRFVPIRNFESYFMGIMNRYMRREPSKSKNQQHPTPSGNRGGGSNHYNNQNHNHNHSHDEAAKNENKHMTSILHDDRDKHKNETKSSTATVEKKKSSKYNAVGEANSNRSGTKLERSVRLNLESCDPSRIESTKENIQPELASSAVVDDDVHMKDTESQTLVLDEAFFNGVASDIYETLSTPQKMVLMGNVSGTDKRTYSNNVSPFSQWLEREIFN